MNCIICGKENWDQVFSYARPDQYELWCGLKGMLRFWYRCKDCGFYQAWHSYDPDELAPVYKSGYRDTGFRNESISEVFHRILSLGDKSENSHRLKWFKEHIGNGVGKVLDIGSGFGIWPWALKTEGWEVECVEPNKESVDFISHELGLPCHSGFFRSCMDGDWDVVSIVHVLEHIKNLDEFLFKVRTGLNESGRVFIEVPDACEFGYLPKEHDEFNSCHLYFFDLSSLNRLLNKSGLEIMDAHRIFYNERRLSRMMVICKKQSRQ